jgi:hypothetical protein
MANRRRKARVDSWALKIPIIKSELKEGLVTGWASIVTRADGQPIVDADGHVIPIQELRKAVHKAMLSGGEKSVGDMHEVQGVADIVDSFVIDRRMREGEMAKSVGLTDGPEGWLVTLRIHDPKLRDAIAAGQKLELSIRGRGERVDIGEVK